MHTLSENDEEGGVAMESTLSEGVVFEDSMFNSQLSDEPFINSTLVSSELDHSETDAHHTNDLVNLPILSETFTNPPTLSDYLSDPPTLSSTLSGPPILPEENLPPVDDQGPPPTPLVPPVTNRKDTGYFDVSCRLLMLMFGNVMLLHSSSYVEAMFSLPIP